MGKRRGSNPTGGAELWKREAFSSAARKGPQAPQRKAGRRQAARASPSAPTRGKFKALRAPTSTERFCVGAQP